MLICLRRLFFVLFFLPTVFSLAQDLELKYAEFKDNKLVVHYSLKDSVVGRFYTVRLYSSKDNFLNPLEKVFGDLGLEIKPGLDNKITWDVITELGPLFDERISLEIRGRIFVPFINVESINQYKVYKRLRKYNLTWSGGTPQNILNFDVYSGEKRIITYSNIANVGTYSLEFPRYVKPKKDYRFRISDSKNKEDVVYTNTFKIRRKVPLLVQFLPALAAGYVAYLFFGSGASPDSGIPDPPKNFSGH